MARKGGTLDWRNWGDDHASQSQCLWLHVNVAHHKNKHYPHALYFEFTIHRNCRARLEEHNSRRRKVMVPGSSGSTHQLSGSRTTTRREAERQGRTAVAPEKKELRGGGPLEFATSKGTTGFAPATRRPSAAPVEGPISTSSAGGYLEPELVMSVLQNMSSLPLRTTGTGAGPPPAGGPTWPAALRAEGDLPGTPARSTEPLLAGNLLQDLAIHQTSSSQSALGNLLERILSEPLRSSAAPNSASTATHLGLGPGYGEAAGQNEASLSSGVNQLLSLWSGVGLPSEDLGRMLSSSGSRQLSAPSLLPQLSSILAEAAAAPASQPAAQTASPNAPRQASVRLLRGPDPAAQQRSPFQVVVPGGPGSRHLVPTVPRSGLTQEGSGGSSSAMESAGGNGSGAGQRLDVGPFEALPNPFERRASGSQRMSSATTSTGGEPGAGPPPAKRLALARSVAFVPAPSQPPQEVPQPQLTPEALALLPAINQLLADLLAGQPLAGPQAQSQVTLLQDLLQQIVAPRR